MVTVKLTQDIEGQGLFVGDVMSVDKFSAESMIKRGVAEKYDADAQQPREVDEPAGEYGGKPAQTIDDIHDPEAQRDRRVTTVVRVGGPDPGPPQQPTAAQVPDPVAADKAAAPPKSSKKAASGAQPAGGDAGGGDDS